MKIFIILEGNIRHMLNIKTSRMVYTLENYCKKCPVSHEFGRYTGQCNKDKGGCGCITGAKSAQSQMPCPLGFWSADWFKEDLFKEFIKNNPI